MLKLHRAVYYYYVSRFCPDMHQWLISITGARRKDSLIFISDETREKMSDAQMSLLDKKADFDYVIQTLIGDEYFDRNKSDIAKLQKAAGKKIIELWDTDPIFAKYPHLRGLGRNKFFEENILAKIKSKQK